MERKGGAGEPVRVSRTPEAVVERLRCVNERSAGVGQCKEAFPRSSGVCCYCGAEKKARDRRGGRCSGVDWQRLLLVWPGNSTGGGLNPDDPSRRAGTVGIILAINRELPRNRNGVRLDESQSFSTDQQDAGSLSDRELSELGVKKLCEGRYSCKNLSGGCGSSAAGVFHTCSPREGRSAAGQAMATGEASGGTCARGMAALLRWQMQNGSRAREHATDRQFWIEGREGSSTIEFLMVRELGWEVGRRGRGRRR